MFEKVEPLDPYTSPTIERRVGVFDGNFVTRSCVGSMGRSFSLTLKGSPSLAEPLGAALWAQWSYGFPTVPSHHGLQQLTHGFLHYPAGMQTWHAAHTCSTPPAGMQHMACNTGHAAHYSAGMQPLAAQRMLALLPSGLLLDPFVGGGTTLIEAVRGGRHLSPIGADLSPLAIFASAHHLWPASDDELARLRAQARTALRAAGQGQVGEGACEAHHEPLGRVHGHTYGHTVRIGGLLLERERGRALC